MTNSEAIETLQANYPDPCYGLLRDAVDTAICALSAQQSEQKLWKERYEDLFEYFHGEDIILKDRKEFKAWLERCRWHVRECDKLARQLEAQPEIIRCKDCKYFGNIGDDFMCRKPNAWVVPTTSDFGCVLAERKGKQDAAD